jgi:hypothetical protein
VRCTWDQSPFSSIATFIYDSVSNSRTIVDVSISALEQPEWFSPWRVDIAMTEIRLHRASRMLLIGKRVTAGMPEHVRVDPKVESSRFTETRDQSPESSGRKWCTTLRGKHEWRLWFLLALESAQRPELPAGQGVCGGGSPFDAGNVNLAAIEVDCIPPKPDCLNRAKSVSKGDQDQCRIAVPMPVFAGSRDESIDFGTGEVFAHPCFWIPPPFGWSAARDWTVFDDWGDKLDMRFSHCNSFAFSRNWTINGFFRSSRQARERQGIPSEPAVRFHVEWFVANVTIEKVPDGWSGKLWRQIFLRMELDSRSNPVNDRMWTIPLA